MLAMPLHQMSGEELALRLVFLCEHVMQTQESIKRLTKYNLYAQKNGLVMVHPEGNKSEWIDVAKRVRTATIKALMAHKERIEFRDATNVVVLGVKGFNLKEVLIKLVDAEVKIMKQSTKGRHSVTALSLEQLIYDATIDPNNIPARNDAQFREAPHWLENKKPFYGEAFYQFFTDKEFLEYYFNYLRVPEEVAVEMIDNIEGREYNNDDFSTSGVTVYDYEESKTEESEEDESKTDEETNDNIVKGEDEESESSETSEAEEKIIISGVEIEDREACEIVLDAEKYNFAMDSEEEKTAKADPVHMIKELQKLEIVALDKLRVLEDKEEKTQSYDSMVRASRAVRGHANYPAYEPVKEKYDQAYIVHEKAKQALGESKIKLEEVERAGEATQNLLDKVLGKCGKTKEILEKANEHLDRLEKEYTTKKEKLTKDVKVYKETRKKNAGKLEALEKERIAKQRTWLEKKEGFDELARDYMAVEDVILLQASNTQSLDLVKKPKGFDDLNAYMPGLYEQYKKADGSKYGTTLELAQAIKQEFEAKELLHPYNEYKKARQQAEYAIALSDYLRFYDALDEKGSLKREKLVPYAGKNVEETLQLMREFYLEKADEKNSDALLWERIQAFVQPVFNAVREICGDLEKPTNYPQFHGLTLQTAINYVILKACKKELTNAQTTLDQQKIAVALAKKAYEPFREAIEKAQSAHQPFQEAIDATKKTHEQCELLEQQSCEVLEQEVSNLDAAKGPGGDGSLRALIEVYEAKQQEHQQTEPYKKAQQIRLVVRYVQSIIQSHADDYHAAMVSTRKAVAGLLVEREILREMHSALEVRLDRAKKPIPESFGAFRPRSQAETIHAKLGVLLQKPLHQLNEKLIKPVRVNPARNDRIDVGSMVSFAKVYMRKWSAKDSKGKYGGAKQAFGGSLLDKRNVKKVRSYISLMDGVATVLAPYDPVGEIKAPEVKARNPGNLLVSFLPRRWW